MTDNLANNSQGGDDVVSGSAGIADTADTHIVNGADDNADGDEDAAAAAAAAAELEDVDYEDKKYRLPKELKGALLRQADYTRKTQEVADSARAVEERDTAIKHNERLFTEHREAFVATHALDSQVKEFEKVNWQALNQQEQEGKLERGSVQTLWLQYQQLKDARDNAGRTLQQKIAESSRTAAAQSAKRIEEGHASVARDIKDWTPESFGKAKDFAAREFGFKADELASISDPRMLKVLHRLALGDQAIKKLAASNTARTSEEAKPLPTVTGNTRAAAGLRDADSMEAWMKKRNEQSKRA